MISWRLAAAWVTALVVTTVLTWQIVSLADSQVGNSPAAVAPITASPPGESSTTPVPSTSSGDAAATSSIVTTIPSQSTPTSIGTSPSATTSPSGATWSVRTVNTSGGSVVVRYRPDVVELQAATPAPGFDVEIDDPGPPQVRVEFESEGNHVRIEVEWGDGDLHIEVSGEE
jgi:hypothetical protein